MLLDLEDIVTDGLPESPTAAKIKEDRKAQAHIRLKLGDKILEQVKDLKNAKEIIQKLESLYDRKNIVSIALLEEEYNSRKILENENIDNYLNDLNRLRSDINAIQADSIKPFKHVFRILIGLSNSSNYKNVVSGLYTMASGKGDDVSIDDVINRLMDECRLFNLDHSAKQRKDNGPKGSAMKAGPTKNRTKSKPFECWSCGDKDSRHDSKKAYCSLCGQQGHRASKCPERPTDGENKKGIISMMATKDSPIDQIFLDSGSSHHIARNKSLLHNYESLQTPIRLETSKSGSFLSLIGKGDLKYKMDCQEVIIKDIYFCPEANANLLSNSVLDRKGALTTISKGIVKLYTHTNELFMCGTREGSLYAVNIQPILNSLEDEVNKFATMKNTTIDIADANGFCGLTQIEMFHKKLGHANFDKLSRIMKQMDPGSKFPTNITPCIDCSLNKITRSSFKSKSIRKTQPLELIHSDVGFINAKSHEGHTAFVIFIDDYSNFAQGFILSSKGQAADAFYIYTAAVETKFGSKIKTLRIDEGKEYKSTEFLKFCKEKGIILETTDGYTPELNGKSERYMRTVVEMLRTVLNSSKLPLEGFLLFHLHSQHITYESDGL